MRYSLIIPVYNRPQEAAELLKSLAQQTFTDFEAIIVEDGSTLPCQSVVQEYVDKIKIRYLFKPNTGPGDSRNYGATHSSGEYIIVLDSDCIVPEGYLQAIEDELCAQPSDAFGGPDAAMPTFSPMQKAVNYAMTSFLTTGGIRGRNSNKNADRFYPRSFNMGISRPVYQQLGGFADMRYGEDIDFSIRIFAAGYAVRLFSQAYVYHKRRTNLRKFFVQVWHSGFVRIALYRKYPASLKLVHCLPAMFTLGCALLAACSVFSPYNLLPVALFAMIIFVHSTAANKNMLVGCLSVAAALVQLWGYGTGFIAAAAQSICKHKKI
jgi:glycosyltransferase involved in cell wall biosynthesis